VSTVTTVPAADAGGGATGRPVTGRIHSWDLSTGVDGPGTRFVLFVSGCPLRRLYCANPDTWHMRDGRTVTVDEVMAETEKYRPFLTTADGGVTLTGGEALLQPAFTGAVLRRCKEGRPCVAGEGAGSRWDFPRCGRPGSGSVRRPLCACRNSRMASGVAENDLIVWCET
jgi:hypothetical protein